MLPIKFTKTAGTLAVVSAFLWLIIVVSWWIAAFLEPVGNIDANASGAVFAIGYISFQLAGIFLPVIMGALHRYHDRLSKRAMVGIGFIVLAIPANVIPACFMCWGSLMMIGTILFGTAMLDRHLVPRLSNLAFGSALAVGAIVWLALRIGQGTLLEWGGIFGAWVPNLTGISVAGLIFALGLFRLGVWLRNTT